MKMTPEQLEEISEALGLKDLREEYRRGVESDLVLFFFMRFIPVMMDQLDDEGIAGLSRIVSKTPPDREALERYLGGPKGEDYPVLLETVPAISKYFRERIPNYAKVLKLIHTELLDEELIGWFYSLAKEELLRSSAVSPRKVQNAMAGLYGRLCGSWMF